MPFQHNGSDNNSSGENKRDQFLPRIHTHTHAQKHTHTHTLTNTHTHTLTNTLSHTHTHTKTHTHTQKHTHTLSQTHTHTHLMLLLQSPIAVVCISQSLALPGVPGFGFCAFFFFFAFFALLVCVQVVQHPMRFAHPPNTCLGQFQRFLRVSLSAHRPIWLCVSWPEQAPLSFLG